MNIALNHAVADARLRLRSLVLRVIAFEAPDSIPAEILHEVAERVLDDTDGRIAADPSLTNLPSLVRASVRQAHTLIQSARADHA